MYSPEHPVIQQCCCLFAKSMQGRAQRIAGEQLPPQSRGEFVDAAGRMLADTLQDIDQILVGIDTV